MKIEDLANSKKKSKLLEKVRGTTRPGVFFTPKRSKPRISKPRISKPKISDIETDWDFKPVPIATPPLIPGTGTPPGLGATVPSPVHKPVEFPKLASVTDTVPDWKPGELPDPVYNPVRPGVTLPEPEWGEIKKPELDKPDFDPDRPELKGSGWGADRPGIDIKPVIPLFPPTKGKPELDTPLNPISVKDIVPKITREPLPVPKDLVEPGLDLGDKTQLDISKGPVGGPIPGRLPHRRPYTDEIDTLHDKPMPGEDFVPVTEPIGGEKPHPIKYAELSDKEKKVFWRVLKGVEDPTAEMLEVHPNEWKEIIPIQPKTELDKQAIGQFFNPGVVPTWRRDLKKDVLAPRNPEKGADARDFWENLGYSSLAQFEKAQKDGGGGKIGYAKGKTTGKQVPVVYPKQAYISKQAFDTGLKIGPKGNIVTRGGKVAGQERVTKADEPTDTLDLDTLKLGPGVLSIPKSGEVAGGTDITPYVQPELSGPVKQAMHNQLKDIAQGNQITKEQRAIIKDINSNYDLLSKKDQQAVTTYMKWVTDKYVDPKDPDMYHFGSGSSAVHLTGEEVAKYLAVGTGVALGSLALLLPAGTVAGAGTAIAGTISAARLTIPVLIKLMNMVKNSGMIRFATP